jgi:hypothetical protein
VQCSADLVQEQMLGDLKEGDLISSETWNKSRKHNFDTTEEEYAV